MFEDLQATNYNLERSAISVLDREAQIFKGEFCMNECITFSYTKSSVDKQKRRAESARSCKTRSRNYRSGSRLDFTDL